MDIDSILQAECQKKVEEVLSALQELSSEPEAEELASRIEKLSSDYWKSVEDQLEECTETLDTIKYDNDRMDQHEMDYLAREIKECKHKLECRTQFEKDGLEALYVAIKKYGLAV